MSASISVYIPSFNQRNVLVEAVDSVLAQTLRPTEIIIIDDASTDGSQDVIAGYVQAHPGWVRAIYHKRNMGVTRTRNEAVREAVGEYISYVDGDDRWLPGKLQAEFARLNETDADFAYSNHYNMTQDGRRVDTWINGEATPEGDVFNATLARAFPRRDIFRMELVRTEVLRDVGAYRNELKIFEDFDMRIRLTKQARACFVDEPMAEIRRHTRGLSSGLRADTVAVLDSIWEKNVRLLDKCGSREKRMLKRGYFGWMAPYFQEAAYEALYDVERSQMHRRLRAMAYFSRTARFAPDRLSLGDMYRVLLPDAWAQAAVNRKFG
ncbi:MAG: glycosyltransferase [Kiritimatiellae bacterium]|nr:glycosyltransferase [Kiritimatiellia bacterium]